MISVAAAELEEALFINTIRLK